MPTDAEAGASPPAALAAATRRAQRRLHGHLRVTPLLEAPWLTHTVGRPVYLKCESLQVTGSFKARGALNFLLTLSSQQREQGVMTASAGNHGQALAWAATRLGVAATVVLPCDAVPVKVARTRAWGVEVVLAGDGYDEAHDHAERLAAQRGLLYAPAYDHPAVMAGQGTVALEIVEALPTVAAIVVPVGGGGLVCGIAAAATIGDAAPCVLGVQSERTPALHEALAAGRLLPVATPPTLADGLAGATCQTALELCRALGVTVTLVPEAALLPAMRDTLLHDHLAIEGSAAVAVAALQHGLLALPPGDGPIVALLSGGNVDPMVLAQALGTY